MKSRGRKGPRRERKKKEDQKRERVRAEKDQRARKGRKVAKRCVFQCFVALKGRKVGSLSGGCGATWADERSKIEHGCGAKPISNKMLETHRSGSTSGSLAGCIYLLAVSQGFFCRFAKRSRQIFFPRGAGGSDATDRRRLPEQLVRRRTVAV